MIWLKKFWWVLVAVAAALLGLVLVIMGKRQEAEKLAAVVTATRAKVALEHLNEQNQASNKALEELAGKRANAEAVHKEQVAKLTKQLKDVDGMDEEEINAELRRRGHV